MRKILNGKIGRTKGIEIGERMCEWLLYTINHSFNEELAHATLNEESFISIIWDCCINTKHGAGESLLTRLQQIKFNQSIVIPQGCSRSELLHHLLDCCPMLN